MEKQRNVRYFHTIFAFLNNPLLLHFFLLLCHGGSESETHIITIDIKDIMIMVPAFELDNVLLFLTSCVLKYKLTHFCSLFL